MNLIPQPRWMADVKVGDVLARASGPWRVVRDVKRKADGRLWGVTFVIRRCSWTGRCYTILTATDLRILGYRRMPRVRCRILTRGIDAKIAKAINEPCTQKSLTCCAVVGIP